MWHVKTHSERVRKPWLAHSYISVFALVFGLSGLALISLSSAQTPGAELYVKPGTTTVDAGKPLTVQVRINDADAVTIDYAKAYLTFPPDQLTVTGISTANSNFRIGTELTYNNTTGTVHIVRQSAIEPQAPTQLIATIKFVTKTSGTAVVSYDAASALGASANTPSVLNGTTAGTYTINAITSGTTSVLSSEAPGPNDEESDDDFSDESFDEGVDETYDESIEEADEDHVEDTDIAAGEDTDDPVTQPPASETKGDEPKTAAAAHTDGKADGTTTGTSGGAPVKQRGFSQVATLSVGVVMTLVAVAAVFLLRFQHHKAPQIPATTKQNPDITPPTITPQVIIPTPQNAIPTSVIQPLAPVEPAPAPQITPKQPPAQPPAM